MRYCFYCREKTPTIDEDCTICNFSKVTPKHLRDKDHLDYMNRCLDEETTDENLEAYGEGVLKHWGYHFYQIYPSINAMGGWANFRSWVKRHAETYFNYCTNHKNVLAELVRLKKVKDSLEDIEDETIRSQTRFTYQAKKQIAWKQAFKLVEDQYDYTDDSPSILVSKKLWNQTKSHKIFLEGLISKQRDIIRDLENIKPKD